MRYLGEALAITLLTILFALPFTLVVLHIFGLV